MIANQNMSTNPVGFNKFSKVHERQNNNSQNQNFQSRPNNNQFQAILSQLLPLLIQLLNSLQNNKPTCDPLNPKEVPLSSVNVDRLIDSYKLERLRELGPVGGGLLSITSILDKDCSGGLSVGDQVTAIYGQDTVTNGVQNTNRLDLTINNSVMNLYNSTEVLFPPFRN